MIKYHCAYVWNGHNGTHYYVGVLFIIIYLLILIQIKF